MAPPPDALVIGCGYLGRRVAALWRDGGRRVAALTRGRSAELASLGLEPVAGDVLDPVSLRRLPEVSTVLYAVALGRTSGRSMREGPIAGLGNVLAALGWEGEAPAEPLPLSPSPLGGEGRGGGWMAKAALTPHPNPPPQGGREQEGSAGASPSQRRFLYVSSTSVYGQTDGSEVDEASPTEPVEEAGWVALDAERLLREKLPSAVVLRFAGIYGPDRLLRRQALLNGEPLAGDADKWLNLIHVADGARAVLAAEDHGRPDETYIVADGTPVRRREFYTHLAQLLGAPAARFEPHPPGVAPEPNRRVSNRKLRALGWAPQYPSFVDGLAASL